MDLADVSLTHWHVHDCGGRQHDRVMRFLLVVFCVNRPASGQDHWHARQ